MFKSLSHYVNFLEQSGELVRISAHVNPAFEMAEIVDRCSKSLDRNVAILFENNGSSFPVLMNMMGSEQRICAALGVEQLDEITARINTFFEQVIQEKTSLWDKLKLLPSLCQASSWLPKHQNSSGACQQVVVKEPRLSYLPIITSWTFDGGPFITLPMVHTQDLQTGARNVGMYRMQVFDEQTTGMHWHIHKTGARHFAQYKAAKKRMPVVVTLGGDPIYTYCATAPMPDNLDEYLLAGFLRNRPVSMVRCITQPLCVPADVDFVIEGYVDPQESLVTEGPFGDHTGFYSLPDLYPKFHITCITHRKNAIYPATLVGIPPQEDAHLGKASERIFLAPIRLALQPEVLDMDMPVEGVTHNIVIVKIKKTYTGQAPKVASALWGAGQMMLNKTLVVVDEDTDVHNYAEIVKIAAQRFNPLTDVYFGKGPLDVLDHAAQQCGFGGKICLDLTKKMPNEVVGEGSEENTLPLFSFHHQGETPAPAKITVRFDCAVDLNNLSACVWLLGNNIDPDRDCKIVEGQLQIDATSKPPKENSATKRPWPNVVSSSEKTILQVDKKWEQLGLGNLILSPSLLQLPSTNYQVV